MQVKINNYPRRLDCSIFIRYMDKKYNFMWPEKHTLFENCLEKLEDGIQAVYDVFNRMWFDRREQKISVQIDPWDTWSMDHTLAYIVLPMLKQLKETKQGAPVVDNEDVPAELRMPEGWYEDKYRRNGETDPHFFDRWDWVMAEMIWAFEQKQRDDWESDYYKYEPDPDAQFGVKCVWSDDKGRKAHQERMSNGFRLFGKYYEALWT